MHGLDICKSSYLSGQYAGSSSVFLQIKTLIYIKSRVAMQMNRSSTSSGISFHGLPSKSKSPSIRKQIASSLSSQLIVLVFTKQPSAERFFRQYFFELLENSSSASIFFFFFFLFLILRRYKFLICKFTNSTINILIKIDRC